MMAGAVSVRFVVAVPVPGMVPRPQWAPITISEITNE